MEKRTHFLKPPRAQMGLSQTERELRVRELDQENAALIHTTAELEDAAKRFEAMTGRLEETTRRLRNRVQASERGRLEIEQRNRTLIEQNRRLQIESQANARFFANNVARAAHPDECHYRLHIDIARGHGTPVVR